MPWRALIVGAVAPVTAAVIGAWIGAGNSIAAFWHAAAPAAIRRDRRLSCLVPRWSVAAARKHRFPVLQVPRLATWPDVATEARATGADVLISAYFKYLVPRHVLDAFGSRAVNLHPAPLPRYRGPHPVVAMVLDRSILTDGAMTLHVLDDAFDEGPIVAREPVPLPPGLSLGRYHLALSQAAAHLTGGALQRYLAGDLEAVPQEPGDATYARVQSGARDLLPTMTADEIRWRCRTFATSQPVGIPGVAETTAVGFRRIVGPPTGDPPMVGPLSVEFDVVDARISVWRKLPGVSKIRRLRRLADLARTPAS